MDTKEHPTEQDSKTLKPEDEIKYLEKNIGALKSLVSLAEKIPGVPSESAPSGKQIDAKQLDQIMSKAFPDKVSPSSEKATK